MNLFAGIVTVRVTLPEALNRPARKKTGPHRQISISGRLGRAADYRSRGLRRPTSTRPPTTLPASFPQRRSVAAERAENFPAGRPASRAAQATWLQEQ